MSTYPSLQYDISCEVLVVGSGITGALLAYQFSGEGYDTVLIDKRDIATGSTAATTAMLQYEIDIPLYKLIDKVGQDIAVQAYQSGVGAIMTIEKIVGKIKASCDFKRKGSLYLAASQQDCEWLYKEFECRKKFGFDVQWLGESQLYKYYGVIGQGAILSQTAASLDAYSLAHQLIDYSVRNFNLRVFDKTFLDTVTDQGAGNVVLTQSKKKIKCRYILYGTGYEAAGMVKEKIVDLRSTFAFVSEPVEHLPAILDRTIFWNTENPYLYMRTTDDNRILIGGGDEPIEDAAVRDSLIKKKRDYLLDKLHSIFPKINAVPDLCWAGTFGVTKDALPYIGPHPDFPNSFFVLGFGGNGITFSVAGMDILSDAIAGRPNKFLEYYRFGR